MKDEEEKRKILGFTLYTPFFILHQLEFLSCNSLKMMLALGENPSP
jgi:hypothetical protein